MFSNWNILKHVSLSVITALCMGLISYFIINPVNSATSIGFIEGDGPSAIYTSLGFDTVIIISIGVFIVTMMNYKLMIKLATK